MKRTMLAALVAVVILTGVACTPAGRSAPGNQYPVFYTSVNYEVGLFTSRKYCDDVSSNAYTFRPAQVCRHLLGVKSDGSDLPLYHVNPHLIAAVTPWIYKPTNPSSGVFTYGQFADTDHFGRLILTTAGQLFEGCWQVSDNDYACDFVSSEWSANGFKMRYLAASSGATLGQMSACLDAIVRAWGTGIFADIDVSSCGAF